MTALHDAQSQPSRRLGSPRWVNISPSHELHLSAEYLENAPAGTVLSVLGQFGSGSRLPIAFAKRHDGTWVVHARGRVSADRLLGGRATPRRRAGSSYAAGTPGESASETVQPPTPPARASFANAVARTARARR